MKDTQVAPASAEPRIFLVSPILHCVSMTALVYLRSNFGFAFLRPKSIFIASSWAFILFAVYAHIESDVWHAHRAVLWFGVVAVALYQLNLAIALLREWNGGGEHDNYSGTPHLFRLSRLFGHAPSAHFDAKFRRWGEPAIIGMSASLLYLFLGRNGIVLWLLFAALCLLAKEVLNHWFSVRERKREKDMRDDTEHSLIAQQAGGELMTEAPKTNARKSKIVRQRVNAAHIANESDAARFAKVLRMIPPFDLPTAEQNYRLIIKETHSDTNEASESNREQTRQLNDAIEYFRTLIAPD